MRKQPCPNLFCLRGFQFCNYHSLASMLSISVHLLVQIMQFVLSFIVSSFKSVWPIKVFSYYSCWWLMILNGFFRVSEVHKYCMLAYTFCIWLGSQMRIQYMLRVVLSVWTYWKWIVQVWQKSVIPYRNFEVNDRKNAVSQWAVSWSKSKS